MFQAIDRQRKIYLEGVSGKKPKIPVDAQCLALKAREYMTEQTWAYIAGGAGAGTGMRNNRAGFDKWAILPRMLRDVSAFDSSISLFGKTYATPLLLAPVGVLKLAHRKADLAVAQAAAEMQVPMIFSNQASYAMEACAAQMKDQPRWFQLYWSKSSELVTSFVKRAEACGCDAIVITLDTGMLGWRPEDLDLAYLPFLRGEGIAQYTSDPVFQQMMQEPPSGPAPKRKITLSTIRAVIQLLRNYPGSFTQHLRTRNPMKAVRTFINTYTNPALNWEQLSFIREQTKLPILLKGILHPEDAAKAIDMGMDGIVVSNHGGRQVDGVISAIEALPGIVEKVNGRIPILLDSGVRTGSDVFKALALGATAVGIGRPYVYGLAIDGQQGVAEVLQNILAELELTMRLSGCRNISEVNEHCLLKSK
jgi:lactate 2-monooxygenase